MESTLSLRPRAALSALVLWASLSAGCAPVHPSGNDPTVRAAGPSSRIEGTATYRERIALPPGAIFEAFLEDVSNAEARPTVVGRTTIRGPSQPPIRFSIEYDPVRIDSRRSYAVRARILFGDRAQFKSEGQPVLTQGAGRSVDLLLRRSGSTVDAVPRHVPREVPRDEPPSARVELPPPPPPPAVVSLPPPAAPPASAAPPPPREVPPAPPVAPPPPQIEEPESVRDSTASAPPRVRIDENVDEEVAEGMDKIGEERERAAVPPPVILPSPRIEDKTERLPASSLPDIEPDRDTSMPLFPPRGERQPPSRPAPPPALPGIGAHGMRLPATFRGDFPCADCEAIRYHLNLWPDQSFQLRRQWVGRNQTLDVIGRWRVEPDRNALVLYAGDDALPQFEIVGEDRLRPLGTGNTPSGTNTSPYELVSDGALDPIDPSLTFGGEMVYMADAARFTECLTGRDYPIAMEGDYLQLERTYLQRVREPGARLYVTFEGKIADRPEMDGPGTERTVVVTRFINAWPDQQCERAQAHASLTNTYWRIDRLDGKPVERVEDRREPHLILRREAIDLTYGATVGCNQMGGTFSLDGEKIHFRPGASTLMACTPALDAAEKLLGEVLAKTARWRINGSTLELFDSSGKSIGLFEAVYL